MIHTAACLIIGDEVLGGKVCFLNSCTTGRRGEERKGEMELGEVGRRERGYLQSKNKANILADGRCMQTTHRIGYTMC